MCVSGINSCNGRVIILRDRVLLSKFTFLHHLFELKHFSLTFYWPIGKLKLVHFIWFSFWVLIFLLYSWFQLSTSPFSKFLVLHSIVYSTTASHWADWSIWVFLLQYNGFICLPFYLSQIKVKWCNLSFFSKWPFVHRCNWLKITSIRTVFIFIRWIFVLGSFIVVFFVLNVKSKGLTLLFDFSVYQLSSFFMSKSFGVLSFRWKYRYFSYLCLSFWDLGNNQSHFLSIYSKEVYLWLPILF